MIAGALRMRAVCCRADRLAILHFTRCVTFTTVCLLPTVDGQNLAPPQLSPERPPLTPQDLILGAEGLQ